MSTRQELKTRREWVEESYRFWLNKFSKTGDNTAWEFMHVMRAKLREVNQAIYDAPELQASIPPWKAWAAQPFPITNKTAIHFSAEEVAKICAFVAERVGGEVMKCNIIPSLPGQEECAWVNAFTQKGCQHFSLVEVLHAARTTNAPPARCSHVWQDTQCTLLAGHTGKHSAPLLSGNGNITWGLPDQVTKVKITLSKEAWQSRALTAENQVRNLTAANEEYKQIVANLRASLDYTRTHGIDRA